MLTHCRGKSSKHSSTVPGLYSCALGHPHRRQLGDGIQTLRLRRQCHQRQAQGGSAVQLQHRRRVKLPGNALATFSGQTTELRSKTLFNIVQHSTSLRCYLLTLRSVMESKWHGRAPEVPGPSLVWSRFHGWKSQVPGALHSTSTVERIGSTHRSNRPRAEGVALQTRRSAGQHRGERFQTSRRTN